MSDFPRYTGTVKTYNFQRKYGWVCGDGSEILFSGGALELAGIYDVRPGDKLHLQLSTGPMAARGPAGSNSAIHGHRNLTEPRAEQGRAARNSSNDLPEGPRAAPTKNANSKLKINFALALSGAARSNPERRD
jgi:cold shock CspA family protein